MSEPRALHSTRVLIEDTICERWVVVEDDLIVEVTSEEPAGVPVEDYGDAVIAPGFVDTHIHGFAGYDVLTCTVKGLRKMGKALAAEGTTSWLATLPTASVEAIDAACIKVAKAYKKGCVGLKGLFLEGPFLAQHRPGAQNREIMTEPSLELLDHWQVLAGGLIRKIAVAPELDGAEEFAHGCAERGIVCAIGHTEATYDEAREVVEAGARGFVHTFNAMSGLHHRGPGVVGAALTLDGTFCELIADENHVDPVAAKVLVRSRGWRNVVLVTDCLSAANSPDGTGALGEIPVVARGRACHIQGTHILAGSTLTMRDAVLHAYVWGLATLEQALYMGSLLPARSVGLEDQCGLIAAGRSADLVILDKLS